MSEKAKNILMVFVPVLVYFAVAECVAIILHALSEREILVLSGTMAQLIQTLAALPVVFFVFYRPEKAKYKKWHETQWTGDFPGRFKLLDLLLSVALMQTGSYALNNFASLVNLTGYSASYSSIESSFYSGGVASEIAAFVILSPIAEELLYRGVVFLYMKRTLGVWPAVVVSSIMFAMFHMNLVQLVYALFLGFYLGILMERSENLWIPIAGHAAANALSVVRGETGFLSMDNIGFNVYVGSAVAAFVISLGIAVYICIKLGKRINIVER